MRALAILCAAASALAGCEPPLESEEIATRDMSILLDAVEDGSRATVTIRISSVRGDVELTGADSLKLTTSGAVWPLKATEDGDGPMYLAEMSSVAGDLVLDLKRRHDHDVHRIAALPPPFTLAAQGLSATQPLRLTWDAGSGEYVVSLAIEGSCIHPLERMLAKDTGAYSVQMAELQHTDPAAPATCPLEATLTRAASTEEPLVPPLEGGRFTASTTQRRTLAVDWQP